MKEAWPWVWVLIVAAGLAWSCSGDYDNDPDPFPAVPDDDLSDDDVSDDDLDDDGTDDDFDDDADDDVEDILPEGNEFYSVFFDVGLGDASLFAFPDGSSTRYMLVDGGTTGEGTYTICPILQAHGIDALDLMVVTHADFDHCGGAAEIFGCVDVGMVWENGEANPDDEGWVNYVAARETWGGAMDVPAVGDDIEFGEARVLVLNTNAGREGYNNDSISLTVTHPAFSVFVGADAQSAAQDAMLANHPGDLAVEVVRVPDHAGPDFSQAFVDHLAVTMEFAVISVGPTEEDYPNADTLAAYEATDAEVLLTMDVGHVIATEGDTGPEVTTIPSL